MKDWIFHLKHELVLIIVSYCQASKTSTSPIIKCLKEYLDILENTVYNFCGEFDEKVNQISIA